MKKTLLFALLAAVAFSAEGYKILNKIKVGGTGGWDYLAVDPATQRIFASHGGNVEVVDIKAGKAVGQITQLHGVHGIAVASDVGKGFISNGQSNSVTIFDLKTLQKTGEPATGQNPDAICYEPKTQRIFTMNGKSAPLPVMGAFHVLDGKITAWRDYFDMGQVSAIFGGA